MVRIEVSSSRREFRSWKKIIDRFGKRALKYLRKDKVNLEVYLIGNKEIKVLNNKFRGKNEITDVLSFRAEPDFIYPPSACRELGEIYLNVFGIRKKDPDGKKILLLKLFLHGLLHLLGYTHGHTRDRIKMERLEYRLLKFLG